MRWSCVILRRVFFVYARLGKDYAVKLLRCLIGWRHILPRPNSLFWTKPFFYWVLAGNRFENSQFKKSDFSSKSWLKFMHGRYVPTMHKFKPWLWREVRLFELRILKTIARQYSIKKWFSSKERVRSREDVTSSNQTTQQLHGIIFSKASVDKKHTTKDNTWPPHSSSAYLIIQVCLDVLIGWRHIPLDPTLLWTQPFLNWVSKVK